MFRNEDEQETDSRNGLTEAHIFLLVFQLFLNLLNFKNVTRKRQWACAVLSIEGSEKEIFSKCKPSGHLHTEEKLIPLIDKFLETRLGNLNTTQKEPSLVMYTYNSPCIQRRDINKTPCYFLIADKAAEWKRKYNLRTSVGYTVYWGPVSYTNIKIGIQQSTISSENSIFYQCREEKNWISCIMNIVNNVIGFYFINYPKCIFGEDCPLTFFFTEDFSPMLV